MESHSGKSCNFVIPQRFIVVMLVTLGIIINWTMYLSLPPTLRHLTVPKNISAANRTVHCHYNETRIRFVPVGPNFYEWHENLRTYLQVAYYWSFIVGHFPGGVLADQYGGKHVFGAAVIGSSVIHCLMPFLIPYLHAHLFLFIIVRSVYGFINGMVFPSGNSMLAHWVPSQERGALSCFVFSATQFAVALNHAITNSLIVTTGTSNSVFYFYTGIAAIWYIFWLFLVKSTYLHNNWMTKKEFNYLNEDLSNCVIFGMKRIPWLKILTSCPLWALILAQFGHTWIWFAMIRDLPKYMTSVLNYDIGTSYAIVAGPYWIMGVCSIVTGFVSDFLINKVQINVTTQRKFFTSIGALGPAIFALAAVFAGCNRTAVFVIFFVGMSIMGFYYSGTKINTLDLAPNFSGTVMALVSGIGVFAGIAELELMKVFETEGVTILEWLEIFGVFVIILVVTTLPFVLFGNGEEQSWNKIPGMNTRLQNIVNKESRVRI